VVDWPATRLGCHLRVKHGFAFQGEHFSDRGDYIVLTPGNFVEAGGFKDKSGVEKYYTATPPADYVLQRGDLIVAMTEQSQGLLGSSAMIPVDNVYLHNQRIGLVEMTSDDVDLGFLYHLFNTPPVRDQIQATATGSKVRHTAPKRIEDVVVPLPPLSTQRKIAAILWAYDDLIENNNRRIKILEEMAQRAFREWFVDFRYPGHEDLPLVDSELGLVPDGWDVRGFEDLGAYVNGFAFKPADWGSEGPPIIKIRELKNGLTNETPRYKGELPAKYVIRDGDLLFSWSADLDVYLWTGGTAWLNQHLFRVDPLADIPTAFLFHALKERMGEFRSLSQGTTMRHIKRAALSQVMSVVPPPSLRQQFAEFAAPIDGLALTLVRATRNAREARDLLLPRLVSGEIDVSNLNMAMPELAA
jgi:type I restriction enzyme, S subunit